MLSHYDIISFQVLGMPSHGSTACDSIGRLAFGIVLSAWRAAVRIGITSYFAVLGVSIMLDVSSTPKNVLNAPYTDHTLDQSELTGQWLVSSQVVPRSQQAALLVESTGSHRWQTVRGFRHVPASLAGIPEERAPGSGVVAEAAH